MNKEDVRQKMLDIVGDIYHADSADYVGNGFDNFDGHTWYEANDTINKAFDMITTDHQKVKLPREVGEYLEHWMKANSIDTIITDLVCYEGDHMAVRNWWNSTPDATYLIADMARYGWEAEPEAKWYVQTPKEWWEDKNKPEYVDLDSMGISDGLKCKEYAAQFTRSELKKYHLDSDIFTLVPVEADKEVSR